MVKVEVEQEVRVGAAVALAATRRSVTAQSSDGHSRCG